MSPATFIPLGVLRGKVKEKKKKKKKGRTVATITILLHFVIVYI
jgi:hypothetical protein